MVQRFEMSPGGGEQSNSLAASVSSGILGLVLGASATFMVMQPIGSGKPNNVNTSRPSRPQSPMSVVLGNGDNVPATGVNMSDLNIAGAGGRGSRGAKRGLATLVGKLELLSRPNLTLRVELDGEQAKAVAFKLDELNKAETLFSDEAEQCFYAIGQLLTSDQKLVISEIALPIEVGFGPASSGPAMSAAEMATAVMGRRDENPFTREVNQKRLRDLLARLSPTAPDVTENSQ